MLQVIAENHNVCNLLHMPVGVLQRVQLSH